MKNYYVTADIHGYFTLLKNELQEQGFDENNENDYLIICGDLFDRGQEAKQLLNWLSEFNKTGRLILIRGNHEDLLDDCVEELKNNVSISEHHIHNMTLDTISQLSGILMHELWGHEYDFSKIEEALKPYYELISSAKNYYELGDYIFVHGWVPYTLQDSHDPEQGEGEFSVVMIPEINLDAEDYMWKTARWYNGMKEWKEGITIPNKTIVCGHWHTSYGNFNYHNIGFGEFEDISDFSPFIDEGIIALDACTAFSGKINVIKLDF